jgi:hypothetical protein
LAIEKQKSLDRLKPQSQSKKKKHSPFLPQKDKG